MESELKQALQEAEQRVAVLEKSSAEFDQRIRALEEYLAPLKNYGTEQRKQIPDKQ